MRNRILSVIFASILLLTGAAALPAFAADEGDNDASGSVGIKVSPVSERLLMNSGDKVEKTVRVTNQSGVDTKVRVYATPYSVQGNDYSPNFSNETSRTQLARWISFDEGEIGKTITDNDVTKVEFPIEQGQEITVNYTINVPKDSPNGGQYAVIFIESAGESGNVTSSGINAVYRVGIIIMSNINGVTRDGAEIRSTKIPMFYINNEKEVRGDALVANTGNTDIPFVQEFKISTLFGREVFTETKSFDVFPDTERANKLVWEGAPSIGIFKASYKVIGLDQVEERSTFIIIMPAFAIIILLLLLTTTIVWLIIVLRKHSAKKARRRQVAA